MKTVNSLLNFLLPAALFCLPAACCRTATGGGDPESPALTRSWKDELKSEIPLLGHRNWIVVTDMAYPLQTREGIKTVYTGESYMDLLDFVYREIENAPHIRAAIYQDSELPYLLEKDVAGIDALRARMNALLGDRRTFVAHETLINRLDEVSRTFRVVILKSDLTVPYTSTFFELDCNYWDAAGEERLRNAINK